MKNRLFYGLCAAMLLGCVSVSQAAFTEAQRQALQLTVDAARSSLQAAGLSDENISLLPIAGDQVLDPIVKGISRLISAGQPRIPQD